MIFLVFDKTTGRILRKGRVESADMLGYDADQDVVFQQEADAVTEYINTRTKVVINRPMFPGVIGNLNVVGNGVDVSRITNIPSGTKVTVIDKIGRHRNVVVDDGVLELTFTAPGQHRVLIDAFPVQDAEIVIDAD